MPNTAVSISTSVIKINLSHLIYNQLVNISKIFDMSHEKQAEHEKNVSVKQKKKKKGIMISSLMHIYA